MVEHCRAKYVHNGMDGNHHHINRYVYALCECNNAAAHSGVIKLSRDSYLMYNAVSGCCMVSQHAPR